jgi:uncharacterized membrane protein
MTVWTAVLFVRLDNRFLDFRLGRFDLGNMVQAVWSTAQGRPLEVTHGTTGEQAMRLGGHVDPILAALAPLWLAFPSPRTLLLVQVAAVALGALPVYWLSRRHLASERAGTLLALAYLAYPWVAWAAVDAFHPVSLALPLLLFALWFLDGDRLVPFAACAVLAAATHELTALMVAGLGVWYALSRGRRRAGLVIACAGVAWTAFAVSVVVPAFSGGPSVFYGAFQEVGGSPAGVLRTAFSDPEVIASAVTESRDLVYLLVLAAPLGGAFVLAPVLALGAAPQLAVNLLADVGATTYPQLHYTAAALPFLVAGSVLGLARLAPPVRERGAAALLGLCVAASLAAGPWPEPFGGAPAWYRKEPLPPERAEALRRAVELVPRDAPVSSTNGLGGHLSARRYVYSVPRVERAEWIVVDSADPSMPYSWGTAADPEAFRAFLTGIERSSDWAPVLAAEGVYVFRRVSAR